VAIRPVTALRSRIYRIATRLGDERYERLRASGAGRAALRGAGRVVQTGPIVIAAGLGSGLLLDTRAFGVDHIQAHGAVRGALEPSVQEALRRSVLPGCVVVDVGASFGFFTLLAARLVGPTGHVHAFEPCAEDAAALRRNLALNDLGERVTVHDAAVSDRAGSAPFVVVRERGWSHLAQRGRHPEAVATREVAVETLDGLLDALTRVDLVKIDVEGSEAHVLDGARELLRVRAPVVVCELHETNAEVCDRLEALGYVFENIDGAEPVRTAGPVHLLARRG
jgi:FkbM family methyltransferase